MFFFFLIWFALHQFGYGNVNVYALILILAVHNLARVACLPSRLYVLLVFFLSIYLYCYCGQLLTCNLEILD